MKAARDEFKRIAELARAGSTTAIQQLQGAGEAFISQMERFGASPGGAAARIEVQCVIESVMADISQAQREASAGLEDTITTGSTASGRHPPRVDRRDPRRRGRNQEVEAMKNLMDRICRWLGRGRQQEIAAAERRQVDILQELIIETKLIRDEIKRLRR